MFKIKISFNRILLQEKNISCSRKSFESLQLIIIMAIKFISENILTGIFININRAHE